MNRFILATLVCLLGACTHEQLYNAVQENRQQEECAKLPQGQYEACMREYGQPYDEYERQRREVLESEAAGN
ncbi:MAG: hypothetical protein Hals2KO_22040 [Halioglobus sp.]